MSRKNDICPGFRCDVAFTDVVPAKALVEIVDRPGIIVVGIPVSAVGVVVRTIVRFPVIPITVVKSPSRINAHFLSGSCLREKCRTADRPIRQAQNKRDCEPLLGHDLTSLKEKKLTES